MTTYDRSTVTTGIVHFGVGRFHRAHEALYAHELLAAKKTTAWGICGVCILPFDKFIFEKLTEQKGVYHLMERDCSGVKTKKVESIVEMLYGYEQPQLVFKKLLDPAVKIVTITVTEAGYFFNASTRTLDVANSNIQNDIVQNATAPKTLYGYLAHGLWLRFKEGATPFTIQSCDNIQGNGDLLRSLLLEFCRLLPSATPEFLAWVETVVTFPNSMVDRITPAASEAELKYLKEELGVKSDAVPVTSEAYRQWVIEDKYCNDRPDWASVGVQLCESVKPYERIKVRLLNAGHSCLGYAGHLAGLEIIHQVAAHETFQRLLRRFFSEVEVTLVPVPGMDISKYQDSLVERFVNPAIEDQVLRICKDGSAKIPGFVLPTLNELLKANKPSICICFLLASYMRFMTVVAEKGGQLDDPENGRLLELATRSKGSAAVFLAETWLFGDLGANALCVKQVQVGYDLIVEHGACGAIERL